MHRLIQTVFGAGLALGCASERRISTPTAAAIGSTERAVAGVVDGRVESEPGLRELRASPRSLGDKPLAILVAGKPPEGPHAVRVGTEAVQRSREQAQRALGSLSTNSAVVVVSQSGHHVPNDAPEVVIGAINAVVKAARTGERLQGISPLSSP